MQVRRAHLLALALLVAMPAASGWVGNGRTVFTDIANDTFNQAPPAADLLRVAHGTDGLIVEDGVIRGRLVTLYVGTRADAGFAPALAAPVQYDLALVVDTTPLTCYYANVRALPNGEFDGLTLYASGTSACSGGTATTRSVQAAWLCNELRLIVPIPGSQDTLPDGTQVQIGRTQGGTTTVMATRTQTGLLHDVAEAASASFPLGSGLDYGARPSPRELTTARASLTNATLSWQAPIEDNGSPLLGYRIYRGGVLLSTVPATTRQYEDRGIAQAATHQYEVRAHYCTVDSAPVAASLTMPAPLRLDLGGPYEARTNNVFTLRPALTGGEPPYNVTWRIVTKPSGAAAELNTTVPGQAGLLADKKGNYTIEAKLVDDDPFSPDVLDNTTVDLDIAPPPPKPTLVPAIHADSIRWVPNLLVGALSTVTGGQSPYLCSWQLETPNAAVLSSDCSGATMAFDEFGVSNATLTVTDAEGRNATTQVVVTIAPSPAGDGDADGTRDAKDNCPATPNADQADTDGDDVGDVCEGPPPPAPPTNTTAPPVTPTGPFDSDKDGVSDATDNCIHVANSKQRDADKDGIGDECEGTNYVPPGTSPGTNCPNCQSKDVNRATPWIIVGVGGAVVIVGAMVILFLTVAGNSRRPPRF